MSVKRYDFDGNADGYFDDPFMKIREKGKFVLASDYAALLARHNALVEAVEWMLDCLDAWRAVRMGGSVYAEMDALESLNLARAEVDRLLIEESQDGHS